jgi:uncharacterized protein YcnI
MRRTILAGIAATVGVVALAAPAWGHATFRQPSVPPDSDQRLVINVPVERTGEHNVKIILEVRPEFKVLGCERKADWDCRVTAPGNRPASLVTWNRERGEGRDNEADDFTFTVHTPKAGRYAFEVNQKYSGGETVRWDGPENSDNPAAFLEVR